ncbi:MAG: ATP-binding protein [Candidatus Delongbacteria bacterium]|nr:ATP-binding protein [Candidatus Delongbacteria bacterium]
MGKKEKYQITPTVDATQEFIEIARDFSNPLEIVREAISNSFDANATLIFIIFEVIKEYGESILQIKIKDNGAGMDEEGLQSFFDLGNSLRRGDIDKIGEKGHGTKVFYNSEHIEVITCKNNRKLIAHLDKPFKKLHDRIMPIAEVQESECEEDELGTEIIITGYNHNRRDKFTHHILKDYILWKTKFGSVELMFKNSKSKKMVLWLQGLENNELEKIEFGHHFPSESKTYYDLFNEYLVKAPDYYCKKIIKTGSLENFPEIKYDVIFQIEGKYIKYQYNPMLRRSGYSAPKGAYTVQEQYGLWLCKDYIPIQRKNEWITYKGSEYTKFHAFLNCQDFRLTANRGSVENTPSEIMKDIESEVRKIYNEIIESNDWRELSILEEEVTAHKTIEKERKDYKWRIERIKKLNIANHKSMTLVEPRSEIGVYTLYLQLSFLEPDLFPFEVIDYDTYEGIDVIVKSKSNNPIEQSKLFYVEFKHYLTKTFNHSFENLHSIICWDTEIKSDDVIEDINKEERKLVIVQPDKNSDYTKYFLDNPTKAHKIEVFVMKDFILEKLGIQFRPRTSNS